MKLLIGLTFTLFAFTSISAQDPTKAAPDSYKLHFENEWVKVLKVRYAPHSKVPVHDHSRFPAAYVYLSDSGPIRFIHAGWDDPVLERPATKAKSFRLSPTTQAAERHEVENPGDLASEFLRIEFKKLKQGQDLPLKRVPPAAIPKDKNFSKVEFESPLIRITRMTCIEGKPLELTADKTWPSMFVVLAGNGKYQVGDVVWLEPGKTKKFENSGNEPLEVLRFDFLATRLDKN